MTSPALRDRPRSLIECREDTQAQVDLLRHRITAWTVALGHADDGEVRDDLARAIDAASDEIGRLEDRLDALDDEIGYRRSDEPGRPIIL